MPNVVSLVAPCRERRRRMVGARCLVSNVNRLANVVGYRVVRPHGESILATVLAPRVPAARFRDEGAEPLVGHHVRPWSRRPLSGCKGDLVLATVVGESAPPV